MLLGERAIEQHLSGRTPDANLNYMARKLKSRGRTIFGFDMTSSVLPARRRHGVAFDDRNLIAVILCVNSVVDLSPWA